MDRLHRGHTLPELVFALAILGGLVASSLPTLRELSRNSARVREVNQFVHAVYLARSEAIKRNGVVSLCPSLDGDSCGGSGADWNTGWIVFVNTDRDSPAVRDAGEELLRVYPRWDAGHVLSNRPTLSFRPYGQSGVTATVTFCDDRGPAAARAVIISQTGRPRISDVSASGKALSCI